jgi:hypothetical protein
LLRDDGDRTRRVDQRRGVLLGAGFFCLVRLLVAPKEILLPCAGFSVLSAAWAIWLAEVAVSATPMAEASKRGELAGIFIRWRDI